jgi:hypothetical protein
MPVQALLRNNRSQGKVLFGISPVGAAFDILFI